MSRYPGPFCGPEWSDHDWHRTIRRGYVVRCHCLRCGAQPLDLLARRRAALAEPSS